MTAINVLDDGEGVIRNCHENFRLFSVNSSQEIFFLFLHVMAMLENIVTMFRNIVIALGGIMTIVGTVFGGFEVVYRLFWTN